MKSAFLSYVAYRLYRTAVSPLFYAAALAFHLFCAAEFFIFGSAFSGNGGAMAAFFALVPSACLFVMPLLCLRPKEDERLCPLSAAKRIGARVTAALTAFCALFIPSAGAAALSLSLFSVLNAAEVFSGSLIVILYALAAASVCTAIGETIGKPSGAFFLSVCALFAMSGKLTGALFGAHAQSVRFYRHFLSAAEGIIDTRSLLYYPILSAAVLCAAVLIVEWKKGRKIKPPRIALYAACLALAFIDAERLFFRADLSGRLSLSAYSRQLLAEAPEPVVIRYYRNRALTEVFPAAADIRDYLLEFAVHDVSVQLFDADAYAELLKGYGIEPYQAPRAGNAGKTELTDVYSAIVVEYGGAWDAAPLVLSAQSVEYEVMRRLSALMSGAVRSVNLVSGNGMDFSDGYRSVSAYLNELGFSCRETEMGEGALFERLKAGGNVTAVLGSDKITEAQAAALEAYIFDGGNVFFAASPFSADLHTWNISAQDSQPLIDMLTSYGFGFSDSLIADTQCARIELTEGGGETAGERRRSELFNYPFWIQPLDADGNGVTLFWPSAVEALTSTVRPLLFTSASSWLVRAAHEGESLFQTNPLERETVYAENGTRARRGAAFLLEGGVSGFYQRGERKHTQIVLVPDQYFADATLLDYTGGDYSAYKNMHFLAEQLLRLGGEPELASLLKKSLRNAQSAFYKTPDEASFLAARKKALLLLFVCAPAGILLLRFCAYVLQRRYIQRLAQCGGDNG